MQEETIKDCPHKDCMYRGDNGHRWEFCKYCLVTGHPRGCGISDCDKYKPGRTRAKVQDFQLVYGEE